MKKITLSKLLIVLLYFFSIQLSAQDGYKYTLLYNGGLEFTIAAVPNASTNTFTPEINQYGITITLPDGITATLTSSLGSIATATPFDGSVALIGQPAIDGYVFSGQLPPSTTLPAPSTAISTPIVTFELSSLPVAGDISLVALNDPLVSIPNFGAFIVPFILADTIDDGNPDFPDVIDPTDSGVTGTVSFNFSVLSVIENQLDELAIYPNPAKSEITIQGLENNLTQIEFFNIVGQRILTLSNNFRTIDISSLQSGVYFAKLYTNIGVSTLKLIKE